MYAVYILWRGDVIFMYNLLLIFGDNDNVRLSACIYTMYIQMYKISYFNVDGLKSHVFSKATYVFFEHFNFIVDG